MVKDIKPYLTKNKRIDEWLKMHLQSFIEKDNKIEHSEVEHIVDYLKSEQSPRRLARLGVQQAKEQSEKWTVRLNKKFKNFSKIESDDSVKIFKTYGNNYAWVQLLSKESFKREGAIMGHCVGSYYDKSKSKIYSLRDQENSPHCTIEVLSDKSISQIKGKANREVIEKYHNFVLDFINSSGFNCNSYYDLKNLDAYKIERDGKTLVVKINQLKEKDTFLSNVTFNEISNKVTLPSELLFKDLTISNNKKEEFNLPKGWSFKQLRLDKVILSNEKLDLVSLNISNSEINVKALKVETFNAEKSTINSNSLKGDTLNCSDCEINSELLQCEDMTIENCKFNNPDTQIICDFAKIEHSGSSSNFNSVFKNAKINDYLELIGKYGKTKFPDLSLKSLNILNTNIELVPNHVKADKIFIRNGTKLEGKFKIIINEKGINE